MKITYSDLFCGVGGFSKAIEETLGEKKCKCVYAGDILQTSVDAYNKIFGKRHTQAVCENINDVEKLPPHDIMFGGFPCQPFSRNNMRRQNQILEKGDERVDLFKQLVRLLIQSQPKYFVFENVSGIKTSKIREDADPIIGVIVSELEKAGYAVKYETLNASHFGVPQRRHRVIFVGIRKNVQAGFSFDPLLKPQETTIPCLEDVLHETCGEKVPKNLFLSHVWRNRKIKNHSVKNKKRKHLPNHDIGVDKPRSAALQLIYDRNKKEIMKPTGKIESIVLLGDTPSGLSRQPDRVYHPKGLAPTLTTIGVPAVPGKNGKLRQLSTKECAALQGLPRNKGLTYKQIANAVCVPMIKAVIEHLKPSPEKNNGYARPRRKD